MDIIKQLEDYRDKQIRLREMQALAVETRDGALMVASERMQDELNDLWPPIFEMLSRIDDAQTYMIAHSYYALGKSVGDIAMSLFVSERTVARKKAKWLEGLKGVSLS